MGVNMEVDKDLVMAKKRDFDECRAKLDKLKADLKYIKCQIDLTRYEVQEKRAEYLSAKAGNS